MLKKDRTRIGVIFSSANPPNMIEFLGAMQAIATALIDKVLYVVDCAHAGPPALSETTEDRCAMAQAAVASFEPFITFTDLDGRQDLVLESTRMANGRERLRADGEDYAFRIFQLNPKDRFTLVFISDGEHRRRTDESGRDDTINMLLLNIKQRYCGFNPELHNVIGLFMCEPGQNTADLTFARDEENLIERGVFSIECTERPALGDVRGGKALARALKDALEGRRPGYLALIPMPVYSYLQAHSRCKQRLIESLAE
jgi:hypothetical protein